MEDRRFNKGLDNQIDNKLNNELLEKLKRMIMDVDQYENEDHSSALDRVIKECKINSSESLNEILEIVSKMRIRNYQQFLVEEILKCVINKDQIKLSDTILKAFFDNAIKDNSDNQEMLIVVNLMRDFKLKPSETMINWAQENQNSDLLADFILDSAEEKQQSKNFRDIT